MEDLSQEKEMPPTWAAIRFEDAVVKISTNGKKIKQHDYLTAGSIPVIDQGQDLIGGYTNDVTKIVDCRLPALVFGDHTRIVKYIDQPFAPGADGTVVICPEGFFHPKLFWYLTQFTSSSMRGKGYARHYQHLRTALIPVPPFKEQLRILAKLDELFSEMDNATYTLSTAYEQVKVYRQSLLKHALEGKLTAKWRQDTPQLPTADQLLAVINKVGQKQHRLEMAKWEAAKDNREGIGSKARTQIRPKPWRLVREYSHKDLPPLPKGWLWLRYGDICSMVRNGISQKPQGEKGVPIFRISAVRAMEFDLTDVRFIENRDGMYDSYFLQPGDLVFTRYNGSRAYVGVCAEYQGDGTHLFPDKLIQTRISIGCINPSYLVKAINSGASRKFISALIRTTAGQSGVSGSDIKSMPVPVCSQTEQNLINVGVTAKLSNISATLDEINGAIHRCKTLRQSILQKAFSGRLVAQDPHDEPAFALIERIRAERDTDNKTAKRRDAA